MSLQERAREEEQERAHEDELTWRSSRLRRERAHETAAWTRGVVVFHFFFLFLSFRRHRAETRAEEEREGARHPERPHGNERLQE